MSKPPVDLTTVLGTIARNTEVLPASGKAVEEMLHPDREEADDTFLSHDDRLIEVLAEKPNEELYIPTPPLPRTENHLLRYFLDGSIRTWFLGTTLEQQRTSPIILAQVGVAVIKRGDNGRLRVCGSSLQHQLLLLLARDQLSEGLWAELVRVAAEAEIDVVDITDEEASSSLASDLRIRASAAGIARMAELESKTALQIAASRSDGWLVLDGSMRVKGLAHAEHTLSIAKSFSKQPEFSFGTRRGWDKKSVLQLLADLPPEHRTAAFGGRSRTIAFWYVRLRGPQYLDYPLMGIVKVEIPNPETNVMDSRLVDEISRAVIAERNVTPYGVDNRWHVHLYPIYAAEQAIQNRFYSVDELRQMIHWPRSLHAPSI